MSDSKPPSGPAPYGVSILSLIHRATPSLGPVELKDDVARVTHIYVVENQSKDNQDAPLAALRQIGSLPRPDAELYAAARTQLPPLFRELDRLSTLDVQKSLRIGFLEAERDDLKRRLEAALANTHAKPAGGVGETPLVNLQDEVQLLKEDLQRAERRIGCVAADRWDAQARAEIANNNREESHARFAAFTGMLVALTAKHGHTGRLPPDLQIALKQHRLNLADTPAQETTT